MSNSNQPNKITCAAVVVWYACLFTLTSGCQQKKPETTAAVFHTDYYPLNAGNKWVYRGSDASERIIEVIGHKTVDRRKCAIVSTKQNGEVVSKETMFATKDGVFTSTLGGKELTGPLPILRLPPRDGRTWKVTLSDVKQSAVFQIGRDKVTVPVGTFDAVTLRFDFFLRSEKKLTHLYWFAKKVGVVKQMIYHADSKVSYELTDYQIK